MNLEEVKSMELMNHLFNYDKVAYYHSVRMHLVAGGQKSQLIGTEMLQCACLLHDLGKLNAGMVSAYVDGKLYVSYTHIKDHPGYSYIMIQPYDEALARIALMHHQFQEMKYPEHFPFEFKDADEEKKLRLHALALSAIDFLDADSYRQGKTPTSKNLKKVIKQKSKYADDLGVDGVQFITEVLNDYSLGCKETGGTPSRYIDKLKF